MNVSIQFAIAESGHFSFTLLAEGTLRTPQGDFKIIEYGRSKKECLERVLGFADLHTQPPNGNGGEAELYNWWKSQVRKAAPPFVDNKSGHWDKWTGPQEYRR